MIGGIHLALRDTSDATQRATGWSTFTNLVAAPQTFVRLGLQIGPIDVVLYTEEYMRGTYTV